MSKPTDNVNPTRRIDYTDQNTLEIHSIVEPGVPDKDFVFKGQPKPKPAGEVAEKHGIAK